MILRVADQPAAQGMQHLAHAVFGGQLGFEAQGGADLFERNGDVAHIAAEGHIFVADGGFGQALEHQADDLILGVVA